MKNILSHKKAQKAQKSRPRNRAHHLPALSWLFSCFVSFVPFRGNVFAW
jgi:hypothetical protein